LCGQPEDCADHSGYADKMARGKIEGDPQFWSAALYRRFSWLPENGEKSPHSKLREAKSGHYPTANSRQAPSWMDR
jgi:hypothetical protein